MEDKVAEEGKEEEKGNSRRNFIKQTLIGGIAVASGVGIGKAVTSIAPKRTIHGVYVDDDLEQERVMKGKEYVPMTKEEKDRMVQMFVNEYKEV